MTPHFSWKKQLATAVAWCQDQRGWRVEFVTTQENGDDLDVSDTTHGVITLNKRRTFKNQFYILLHEMGHMVLVEQPTYEERFGKRRSSGMYSTLAYRVGIVEEEIAAWTEGQAVAEEQRWHLDHTFEALRAKSIATYCLWVNQRKHPHPWFSRSTTEEDPTE